MNSEDCLSYYNWDLDETVDSLTESEVAFMKLPTINGKPYVEVNKSVPGGTNSVSSTRPTLVLNHLLNLNSQENGGINKYLDGSMMAPPKPLEYKMNQNKGETTPDKFIQMPVASNNFIKIDLNNNKYSVVEKNNKVNQKENEKCGSLTQIALNKIANENNKKTPTGVKSLQVLEQDEGDEKLKVTPCLRTYSRVPRKHNHENSSITSKPINSSVLLKG